MNQITALDIQETLKSIDVISIPWIQSQYNFTYSKAKLFLEQLIMRGWVKKEPNGIGFGVVKENLCLRKIERSEVNGLIEDIDLNCISVLDCVKMRDATGVSMAELASAVRRINIKEIIEILLIHNLVYCADDRYFTCVSKKTVSVISDAIRMQKDNLASKLFGSKEGEIKEIVKLFDVLFEDG